MLSAYEQNIADRRAAETIFALAAESSEASHERFWQALRLLVLQRCPLPPTEPAPMSDVEKLRFDQEQLDFGQYAGRAMDDVPRDYLAWLGARSRVLGEKLSRYLAHPMVRMEFQDETAPSDNDDEEYA